MTILIMSDYLDPKNDELLKDFFEEAELQIELFEQNILLLENDPGNNDAIDEIFRAAHTLKGGSGTVEMSELAQFTHLVENVLDELRSKKIKVTENVIDALLSAVDIIKKMLAERLAGRVLTDDISDSEDILNSLLKDNIKITKEQKRKKAEVQKLEEDSEVPVSDISEYELLELQNATKEGKTLYRFRIYFNKDATMNTVGGIQMYAAFKEVGDILRTIPDFESLYEDKYYPQVDYYIATDASEEDLDFICDMPDIIKDVEKLVLSEKKDRKDKKKKKIEEKIKEDELPDNRKPDDNLKKKKKFSSVLRVDSKRIDEFMNLVSEAVINKATFNQISNNFNNLVLNLEETFKKLDVRLRTIIKELPENFKQFKTEDKELKTITKDIESDYVDFINDYEIVESELKDSVGKFHTTAQSLGRITNELQEGVMRIRMVPVANIFNRFPRLVRDLSKELNKNVLLSTDGEETELDKSVIEDLIDPLIHCVRNSIDHGIEAIGERKKAGKPPEGNIILKAKNEGNMIMIEIQDDGKGIDQKSVQERAIKRGIIHPEKKLSDFEAFNLIFEPGFSTANEVTDVSGRGVGLDVVKKKIEKLNGSVSVWSKEGEGTRFTIKLPLTLAIIQGLLVKVGEETYAIPINSVIESHRITAEEIKLIDNYEVFNLREEVISIIRLNRLFKITTDESRKYHYIVLVGAQNNKVGLMVDMLIGEEDVVIKPLKDRYSNSPGIAGATILGDGTVSLIIDVSQLLELDMMIEKNRRQEREARII